MLGRCTTFDGVLRDQNLQLFFGLWSLQGLSDSIQARPAVALDIFRTRGFLNGWPSMSIPNVLLRRLHVQVSVDDSTASVVGVSCGNIWPQFHTRLRRRPGIVYRVGVTDLGRTDMAVPAVLQQPPSLRMLAASCDLMWQVPLVEPDMPDLNGAGGTRTLMDSTSSGF